MTESREAELNDLPVCPVRGEFTACPPDELQPLAGFLIRNQGVTEQTVFPRGTMLPDGRLDLCKQCIGPGGAAVIANSLTRSRQTKHLLLGANGLGSDGTRAIAGVVRASNSLETLYLGCNNIEGDAVEELADAIQTESRVTALWLKRNPIGQTGAAAIARLLRSSHPLECLDLVHTEMPDGGLEEILLALADQNRTVRRLYLCGNRIGPVQCRTIARLLTENPCLQHLYLSVNQLGDAGAAVIASGLAGNSTLQTLSLASNRIGCDGAAAIAKVLSQSQLQRLELGCETSTFVLGEQPNQIGDRGAQALAEALRGNAFLRRLDLRRNRISEVGIRWLLRGLDDNTSLSDLRLGIPLHRDLKNWLNDALRRNRRKWGAEPVDPHIKAIQSVYRAPIPTER